MDRTGNQSRLWIWSGENSVGGYHMPVRAARFCQLALSGVLIAGTLAGVGGAAIASVSSAPSPKLAKFIPASYRVTTVKKVNLDGSRVPQEAVTAVGPVNSSGFATSLVLVLAWDSYVKRWTSVYDTLNQATWQMSSQLGKGPGLVGGNDAGPQVQAIHNQPDGRVDLMYWLNSIEGNSSDLIVDVVHFQKQIAIQTLSFTQAFGHIEQMDQPSKATIGAAVIGDKPHQQIKITLPWLTPDDSQSQGARIYYLTFAAQRKDEGSFLQTYDSQSYVGVGLNQSSAVKYIDPDSPANGVLHVGDVVEGIVGSSLPASDSTYLLGPKVIEEVALDQPGQVVKLSVLRNGQPLTVSLKLAEWPLDQPTAFITTSTGSYDLM